MTLGGSLRKTILTITLWPLNKEWRGQHSQFLRCFFATFPYKLNTLGLAMFWGGGFLQFLSTITLISYLIWCLLHPLSPLLLWKPVLCSSGFPHFFTNSKFLQNLMWVVKLIFCWQTLHVDWQLIRWSNCAISWKLILKFMYNQFHSLLAPIQDLNIFSQITFVGLGLLCDHFCHLQIFVTSVPRVIPVEKICNLEKFQMSVRCGEIWNLLHCVHDLWYFVAFWNIVVQYMGWEWPWSNRCPILPGCHLIYKNMKSIIMLRLLWNIFGDLRCFVAKSVCCDVHAIVRRKF